MRMSMQTQRYFSLLAVAAGVLLLSSHAQGLCPHPEVRLNSRVTLNSDDLTENTIAKYVCDPGFVRLGDGSRVCSAEDTWSGQPPTCATNVAQGKPSNQSSTARGGGAANGNDGDVSTLHDGSRCTETLPQSSPWWRVDLLDEYPIDLIRITTRGCCGQNPLQDIEIRVGSSDVLQQNRLCAWFPGTLAEGQDRDFSCARPMSGRYVFIQMVGVDGAMSLCEVQVFSSHEFAKEQCAPDVPLTSLSLYNKHCYQLQLGSGANFASARSYCQQHSGDLVHQLSDSTFQFLLNQLQQNVATMKTQLLWIGVQKQPKLDSWSWVDGSAVNKPRWGKDQPNSYVGEQNCVVLDGGRKWLWNDVSCRLDYLHWICQYKPQKCGSPDKLENTTISGGDYAVNRTVVYQCPEGHKVVGDEVRTCRNTGLWSGQPPTCKFYQCGALSEVENGALRLVDGRTTFGARAEYTCNSNHTLQGTSLITCQQGVWSAEPPRCLFSMCPTPVTPQNATVQVRGDLAEGSEALFTCAPGHKLIGEAVISCQLGGSWTAPPPLCQLIDCGAPPMPQHGRADYNATYYGSRAVFSCDEAYWLRGVEERLCQEDALWSGEDAYCEAISCGEPEVPAGSYVTGYDFHVHSQVEYHCEPGHLIIGQPNRTCLLDATWSGDVPLCKYVDCGRSTQLLHGNVHYVTGETHLGAEMEYSCRSNYRLLGESVRVCLQDGRWSGTTPVCQEVRCQKPEQTQYSELSVSRNDRMRQKARQIVQNLPPVEETFRVGATVTYRCQPGYKVVGDALRTCRKTGGWSGLPPMCVYVNCGAPEPLVDGSVSLPSEATHYGAIAEYRCQPRYRADGLSRRICLGNATWSGEPPTCTEILCDEPQRPADVLKVATSGLSVGDSATYSCGRGRQLSAPGVRVCQPTGHWNGTIPTCQWVDCGRVSGIDNGRVYHVNKSTVFDSLVEYHCFPQYLRHGPFTRRCREDGLWSGPDTTCLSAEDAVSADLENELGEMAGYGPPGHDAAKTTIIWAGLAIGLFVLIGISTIVVCLRMRRQTVKNTENIQGMKAMEERSAPIMSFNSLDGGPRFNGGFTHVQSRPLPSRPGDEDIYAEADSFSSGTATPPPTDDARTYANSDATYTNGLSECDATYTSGPGDSDATYTNGTSDSAAINSNEQSDSGGSYSNGSDADQPTTVTVNGMAL